jgi:hypothetical protein
MALPAELGFHTMKGFCFSLHLTPTSGWGVEHYMVVSEANLSHFQPKGEEQWHPQSFIDPSASMNVVSRIISVSQGGDPHPL